MGMYVHTYVRTYVRTYVYMNLSLQLLVSPIEWFHCVQYCVYVCDGDMCGLLSPKHIQ